MSATPLNIECVQLRQLGSTEFPAISFQRTYSTLLPCSTVISMHFHNIVIDFDKGPHIYIYIYICNIYIYRERERSIYISMHCDIYFHTGPRGIFLKWGGTPKNNHPLKIDVWSMVWSILHKPSSYIQLVGYLTMETSTTSSYMGLSENSVPLKPMVNDHYPY